MQKEKSQIVATVKKVMPAVVSVVISKKLKKLKRDLSKIANAVPGFSMDDIPEESIDADGNVRIGGGSGFIVNQDGTILTNRHVVSESGVEYAVTLSDGSKFPASILARDPLDDIAILKIESGKTKLPTVQLGNSEELKLGENVLAFGNILGVFQNTVSSGIVSGLSRSIAARITPQSPTFEMRGLVQTDAAINPGNSGGPLTDMEGRAIGINAAVIAGAQNVGFAIPIKLVERDLAELKKFGRIKRPLLGVRYMTLDDDLGKKLDLPVGYGAVVFKGHSFEKAVVPGSPADKAGIREKDIILSWDGEKITQQKNLQDFLSESEVGDVIELGILRNGRKTKTKLKLKERK